jgi:hypothetical protein
VVGEILDLVLDTGIKDTQNETDTLHGMLGNLKSSALDLPMLQATILNTILRLHSGKPSVVKRALAERYHLVNECNRMSLLSSAAVELPGGFDDETRVSSWLSHQSRLRTGLMIWVKQGPPTSGSVLPEAER